MAEEVDTYSIEEHEGRKYVHYNGYTFTEGEEHVPGKPWRAVEFSFLYVDVAETLAEGKSVKDACYGKAEGWKQYWEDLTEEEAAECYADAVRLPLGEVTEETPCGRYYCEF